MSKFQEVAWNMAKIFSGYFLPHTLAGLYTETVKFVGDGQMFYKVIHCWRNFIN